MGGWVPVHSDKLDNLLLSLAKHISNWTYIPVNPNVCLLHKAQICDKSLTTLIWMGQKTGVSAMIGSWCLCLCSCLVSLMHVNGL